MPVVSATLALIIFIAGAVSGSLGALLGLGGGVFLVPFLNLVLGFPFTVAAAISLTTVIATSSSVSAGRAGQQLINMKLGMLLEVATAAGSFLGGVTAQLIAQSVLQKLFGFVSAAVAIIMLTRLRRRNVILDPSVEPGVLGGRFYEQESGGGRHLSGQTPAGCDCRLVSRRQRVVIARHRRRDHQGAGAERVVRRAAARCGRDQRVHDRRDGDRRGTIYYGRGQLEPTLAAAAVLGVQVGSWGGMHFGAAASAKWLKILMAGLLFILSAMMFMRGGR